MKLILGSCVCPQCGVRAELPMLHPNTYGEFILWSEDGQCRYLYALNDAVYSEVGDIVDRVTGGSTVRWEGAEKLQRIFGPTACDRSPEGLVFDVRRLPRCQACGDAFMKFDRYVKPTVVLEVEVAPVSHSDWEHCTLKEREAKVKAALWAIGLS